MIFTFHGCPVHLVNNAHSASLIATERNKLLANGKITASCQACMSPRHYIKRYRHLKWTLYNCFSTVGLTSFQKPQLQSVSILFKFFHPYPLLYLLCYKLFISSFHVLSCYFSCFTQFWLQLPLFEFFVTQPLKTLKPIVSLKWVR